MNIKLRFSYLLFSLFLHNTLNVSVVIAGFTGETLVRTPKNNFVQIKDLKADDKVICFKPGYTNLATQKINAIQKNRLRVLLRLPLKMGM